jgi:hypothetical protein
LEAVPLALTSAATLASLAALHPPEPPPLVPPVSAPALVLTEAIFQHVLELLPRSSGLGLSGWTYDHIRAATGTSPTATSAVLDLLNLLVGGHLPDLPSSSASTLMALEKPRGLGVLPIAIG